ncbi:Polyprenyl synthetase [Beutenbergia cavernae DSM 12333]|uniref:Polyprenyl synthetase n=1 Tax=Beutenbergia cavernae (strain ATCC BAA-8 / DSM 12333 / CCUG 43141 / JCM 11478 / NBRC 16432 / NCIMB 13614 / HKI 0122) TaxID=471853 RepID=C5C5H6_BEUC1|nr:polyprenyl synthetase family protein [Beutenbergia cavernae]ACQ80167.1 Polyprenyl synthetase [Beutenbergia cavernae DSM 12333]
MPTIDPDERDRALVEQCVGESLDAAGAAYASIGPESLPLLAAAAQAATGGKRLRALLCCAAWEAAGGAVPSAGDPVVLAGAALELFQAAALVHDDVMDASDVRRGAPAAHRRLAAEHRAAGLLGDADRFGEAGAILLGDLLLMLSSSTFARAVRLVPLERAARADEVYAHMSGEVTLGQYLDVYAALAPWDPAGDADRARRVIEAKAARYSVEHPLVLGAALAGADDDVLAWCSRVGLPVGTAFQLRDDVLGVFGDPAVTGKPAGDDLREGKRTVLLALGLELADDADADDLRSAVGDQGLDADGVARLRGILTSSGALHAVEEMIEARAQEGLAALADPPPGVGSTERLERLLRSAVARVA